MKKILLIGGTNLSNLPLGGEQYKNQLLFSYLKNHTKLTLIDTHGWKFKPVIILRLIYHVFFVDYDKIIISVTTKSAIRLLKKLVWFENKISKVIYFVVGGNLTAAVISGNIRPTQLKKLNRIIVQGKKIKNELIELGIQDNIIYMPNFKPVNKTYIKKTTTNRMDFRFVFVSSIMEEKGVSLILKAAKLLDTDDLYKNRFKIDFWGPFESNEYEKYFRNQIDVLSNICTYKGYLNIIEDTDLSYSILKEYDSLLFPSTYHGEGFPGVFIDAFIAGLPVVSSDWNMNSEIIKNGNNGLIVKSGDIISLKNAMSYLMDNPNITDKMRLKCNSIAISYDVNKILQSNLIEIL
jgi:glycosyltransferase involved in cell wall biosynthesis